VYFLAGLFRNKLNYVERHTMITARIIEPMLLGNPAMSKKKTFHSK